MCRTVRELATATQPRHRVSNVGGQVRHDGVPAAFAYALWDADMHQRCVCDPGYDGHDCSERLCPRGDDPLTTGRRFCGGRPCHSSTQLFDLLGAGAHTLAVSFEDWRGKRHEAFVELDTLNSAPGRVADADADARLADPTSIAGALTTALRRDFPEGILAQIRVRAIGGVDPVTGALLVGDNIGGRNRYEAVLAGVPGQQALLGLAGLSYSASAPGGAGPRYQTATDTNGETYELSGNREELECAGRGLCDTATGVCRCFAGYVGHACELQNALVF
jgi:hypothetical protein